MNPLKTKENIYHVTLTNLPDGRLLVISAEEYYTDSDWLVFVSNRNYPHEEEKARIRLDNLSSVVKVENACIEPIEPSYSIKNFAKQIKSK